VLFSAHLQLDALPERQPQADSRKMGAGIPRIPRYLLPQCINTFEFLFGSQESLESDFHFPTVDVLIEVKNVNFQQASRGSYLHRRACSQVSHTDEAPITNS
jgi:hypothetical protein